MTLLAQATSAPTPKTKNVRQIAIFYAVILVIMAVAQLFTFDEFLKLMTSFGFPGGIKYAYLIGSLVVVAEIFALPFLLRMSLSPAFRWFSMVCGWFVPIIWAKITLWLVLQDTMINNVGMLGTAVNVIPGWWAVLISFALGILAAWASWGMWPGLKGLKRVSKRTK